LAPFVFVSPSRWAAWRRFSKATLELCGRILICLLRASVDGGWSMTIRSRWLLSPFALALAAVAHAGDQQTRQSCFNIVHYGVAVGSDAVIALLS
jgi:hypothetical protein